MDDQFSETTHQGWFSRIGDAIKGIIVGIVLIIGSIILLGWNEGRAVTTARSLTEGSKEVVPVGTDKVDPANQGKLIHVSGDATTSETLSDSLFNVSANALSISRKVQMYQWVEEKEQHTDKNLGGSTTTTTTYKYKMDWQPRLIRSADFKKSEGRTNPGTMTPNDTRYAEHATMGAFKLPQSVLGMMNVGSNVQVTQENIDKLPADLKAKAKLDSGNLYLGADPASPQIGDQKINFTAVKPGPYSLLAKQNGDTFESFFAKAGGEILEVTPGVVSADVMFKNAEKRNAMITWLVRLGGFIAMSLGIGLIAKPFVVLADVLPFLGNLLGAGVFLISVGLGFVGSLITIAVAWLTVRPYLGVSLLLVAGGALVMAYQHGRKRRAARIAAG